MLQLQKKVLSLRTETNGTLAEWLGTGLQNRRRRFESAKYLEKAILKRMAFFNIKRFRRI